MCGSLASGEQARTAGQALIDEAEHLVVLRLVDQWAQQDAGLHARADADLARFFHQPFDQARGDAVLHQQARGGAAHLALVPENPEQNPFHRRLDIGVVGDYSF